MSRLPRSLIVYVAASSIYAALVFLAVHATYGFELGRSGVRLPDPEALITSIEAVSFVVWLGLSLIAGIVLYLLLQALGLPRPRAFGTGMVVIVALRLLAIRWGLRLPTVRVP